MTWEYVRKFLPIEERPVNMTTASGERLPATLFTIEDVLYLPLSPLGQRIGYDASGKWLVYGRDERLFLWSEANNQIKSGKLTPGELPRRRNVPSREDLVEWLYAVRIGKLTFENVSDLAADALKRTEDMHVDPRVMNWLRFLNGIDLQVEPGVYMHEKKEFDKWIQNF